MTNCLRSYLQSVQSLVDLEDLDLEEEDFVSLQPQSTGCFLPDCLVEVCFAIIILLLRLPPSGNSMGQSARFHTEEEKLFSRLVRASVKRKVFIV